MSDSIGLESSERYSHLVQPLKLAGVVLPNRIARAPHQTTFAQGEVTDQLIAYHVARAEGGVGLTVLETASVHPSSPVYLDISSDRAVDGLARLVEAVRPSGMKLFQQLWHGGSQALPADGSPSWSSSAVPAYLEGVLPGNVPIPMTQHMIDELVESFAQGARRATMAGLDGIEVHAAHGYLPMQFLSPATNTRTDRYGGSLRNRMRFLEEILTAIRRTVGDAVPLGVRFSSADFLLNGLGQEDVAYVSRRLAASGLMDYVSLSVGTYLSPHRIFGLLEEPGYQLDIHDGLLDSRPVPVLVTGRFVTLESAEAALASGKADIVSMVRATIADSHHVRKALRGESPRPCVSCNTCVAGLIGGELRCAVNPTVGYESSRSDGPGIRTRTTKRVLVVGAGAAGLEAARVNAEHGHEVICVETRAEIGGQMRLAGGVPGRGDFLRYVDWCGRQLEVLGVDLRLETPLSETLLTAESPVDAIILASGPVVREELFQLAVPRLRPEIAETANLLSSWSVLERPPRGQGRRAIVLDDVGFAEGFCVALRLIEHDWCVTMVSRLGELSQHLYATNLPAAVRPRLYGSKQFEFLPYSFIAGIQVDRVRIGSLYQSEHRWVAAQAVVPVMYGQPDMELRDLAQRFAPKVLVVGDALAPHRYLRTAIAEGNGTRTALE